MIKNIDEINVQQNRRKLRDVSDLVESIKNIGLINPITIAENGVLVAGLHRLEACKSLGWTEIEVNILSLNEMDCQLAELDENLIRNELTVLERSEHLARRKELYEAKYPQTKQGMRNGQTSKTADIATLGQSSFAKNTAQKTLSSERTIRQDVQIANRIPEEVREIIRETPLANKKTELLMLTQFDSRTQKEVAEMIADEKVETVEQGLKEITKQPAPEGFKSGAEIAKEHKESAGTKWRESLYKTLINMQSIKNLGGIKQLSANWTPELKRQYIKECRQYAETLNQYAKELEETL